jgi:hypothetical protein
LAEGTFGRIYVTSSKPLIFRAEEILPTIIANVRFVKLLRDIKHDAPASGATSRFEAGIAQEAMHHGVSERRVRIHYRRITTVWAKKVFIELLS